MIRIPKKSEPAKNPLNTLRMPARWWGEERAERFFAAMPHASGEAIALSMDLAEAAFRERYADAAEDHLAEAVGLYREAYRVTWERLTDK